MHEIPANGSAELTMLSGHAGAENVAKVEGMFDLWDDFEGSTPSGIWEVWCGQVTPSLTQADGKGTFSWETSGLFIAKKGGPNNDGKFPTTNDYVFELYATGYQGGWRTLSWVNPQNNTYSLAMGKGAGATLQTAIILASSSTQACGGDDITGVEEVDPPFDNGVYGFSWRDGTQHAQIRSAQCSASHTKHARGTELRVAIGGVPRGTGSLTAMGTAPVATATASAGMATAARRAAAAVAAVPCPGRAPVAR